jgi:hypothetical protein
MLITPILADVLADLESRYFNALLNRFTDEYLS